MDEYIEKALELVQAQASVRPMQEEEILTMVQRLAIGLRQLCLEDTLETSPPVTAKSTIKERTIVCLECGKSFRMLTARHLRKHDLSAAEYREKHGYKKDTPLMCKALQRARRKKMHELQLWKQAHQVER